MPSLEYFIDLLGDKVVYSHTASTCLPADTRIRAIRKASPLDGPAIYIGTSDDVARWIESPTCTAERAVLIACGRADNAADRFAAYEGDIVVVDVDSLEVFDTLSEARRSLDATVQAESGDLVKQFFNDLEMGKLPDHRAILLRLFTLPNPPERYCRILLVEPEQRDATADELHEICEHIGEFVPNASPCVKDGRVVALFGTHEVANLVEQGFNTGSLEEYLEGRGAFAALSLPHRRYDTLRADMARLSRMLEIGRCVRERHARVFSFKDYTEYLMIDACYRSFSGLYGSNDVLCLIHPDALELARYDKKFDDCLLDVVCAYVSSGLSVNKTAAACYMHRNTARHKIEKAEAIISNNVLGNHSMQMRFLMSRKVVRYLELFVGEQIEV